MAAKASLDHQAVPVASEEEVRQVLARVLNSRHFVHAPKKQKFLRLICDFYVHGRAGELNEYLIGCEVFDRSQNYNPAADPIVRVGAHDVRKKLELYYQQEGAGDEIRLDIPVGSYEPIFIRSLRPLPRPEQLPAPNEAPAELLAPSEHPSLTATSVAAPALTVAPSNVAADEQLNSLRRRLRWLYAASLLLLVVSGALAFLYLSRQAPPSGANTPLALSLLSPVWGPFLKKEARATLLILSSPAVYRLTNAGDSELALKNSIEVPPDKAAALAQALRDNFAVRNSPPNPRLVLSLDTYTGFGEAIGAQRVTDLLRAADQAVTLKRSRTVSAEDLKDHHVVLLGSVWSNEWAGKLPSIEDFVITGQATIENRRPRAGEATEYRSQFDAVTGRLLEDYALVTVKPNISGASVVMVLAGLRSAGTEAAAEYVTSSNHLSDLNARLRTVNSQNNLPRYYQALLKVGVENGIPTTITLAALHELRGAGQ